jgi:protein TonB
MTKDIFNALRIRGPALFIASAWTRLKGAPDVDPAYGRAGQSASFIKRPMTRALALSLLFHVAFIAAMVVAFGQITARHDETIRVSLVDDLPSGAALAGKAGRSEKPVAPAPEVPRETSRAFPREKKDRMFSARSLPAPPRQPALIEEAVSEKPVVAREPVPVADAISPAPQAPTGDLNASGLGNADGVDYGARGGGMGDSATRAAWHGIRGGGAGSGEGTGLGTGPGTGQAAAYMKEHFVYIRDLIMKNLKYPPAARRLGWKGAVTVSFVVLENGAAQNIKVIKSSGHDILDQAVIKTIQQTQPFPKPPVKAELTIPIVFQLEAGSG